MFLFFLYLFYKNIYIAHKLLKTRIFLQIFLFLFVQNIPNNALLCTFSFNFTRDLFALFKFNQTGKYNGTMPWNFDEIRL